jgi:NAD(P)-dependent dehydrogenase (short-subunit alcohol dehydrogenase family)
MSASVTSQAGVAVITGGESGIGRATALRLAGNGYRVWVGDVTQHPENHELFARLGIQSQHCDVRREADLESLISAAHEATGRLDVLVNNAGVAMVKPITEVTEAEWDRCLDTNLKAAFFGCKHAIRIMQTQGGGAIVNVSSNAGLLPRAHDPVYSISKQALIGLTKSLALCHAGDRIRINAVCPGPVGDTGMMNADMDKAADRETTAKQFIAASPLAHAWRRMITPDEVARAIEYLVSDVAAMVTGTAIAIDGGKSLGVPPLPKSIR